LAVPELTRSADIKLNNGSLVATSFGTAIFHYNSSESQFNYLGHIRLLAKLLHHQPRNAAGRGVPL
jgi:hypothetical protein